LRRRQEPEAAPATAFASRRIDANELVTEINATFFDTNLKK
jgi:hypothetical protein